ncbi:PAS domain-containing protein [Streptomyces sp. TRM43335]|uniref:PAS domain-containing protein n=1 Tax=Streptomyces taklimakanensis TaxID=2569853 RepID=A0A6G2BH59_9ACTN|nr:PAS domain-containing protein [Streptomyces taklimakanensis]MTE21621.1 PAS domain-containing protein [Streptomyces taklimakanensis]
MAQVEEFGAELADFRRRVEELRSARALPSADRLPALDAALLELRHAAEALWPRYEELAAAERHRDGREEHHEHRLLRSLFQRLPVAVVLLDRDGVVRRLNPAATRLFGVRAGYATGRALAGSLAHDSRAVFRSHVAAVARGEGDRTVVVRPLRPPEHGSDTEGGAREDAGDELRATLTTLHPPHEPRSVVLAVFERQTPPVAEATVAAPARRTSDAGVTARSRPAPVSEEAGRGVELMDLLDGTTTALLRADSPKEVPQRAAEVFHGRFADWVVVDVAVPDGTPRRAAVLGPAGRLREAVAEQDPLSWGPVRDAVRRGAPSLLVCPEDPELLGRDPAGAPVLARAEVGSLLCVPLSDGSPGPTVGALTLLRTGGRRAFELAEAAVVDRIARHVALAMRGI